MNESASKGAGAPAPSGRPAAPPVQEQRTTLFAGKHVHFYREANGWEYVHRPNSAQGIAIVAITREKKIVLVEQHRTPLGKHAIELPAGLVDHLGPSDAETVEAAATRELLEETGYTCENMQTLCTGAGSPGLSDELISLCLAEGLHAPDCAVAPLDWPQGATSQVRTRGLAAEGEAIRVYEIPLEQALAWLDRQSAEKVVDLKVYAGLYFAAGRAA